MGTERPRFHVGEYIVLTQPDRGIPAGSVGAIVEIYSTQRPCYRIAFGPSFARGPIPEDHLTALNTLRDRKRV